MVDRVLPTGTLTFLFTDLEGSTRLLHELDEQYGGILETHRRLIRAAVERHGGVEFGTGGDAVFVVFESAPAAVAAAAEANRSLNDHQWPDGVSIRVRMALHTGEARVVDSDYVGIPLHVVARLCGVGHGGQVLLSEATQVLTHDAIVDDLGRHRLRDIPNEIQIFQLRVAGVSTEFPPLRTLSVLPNNLPASIDRLIGRELDIVDVVEALNDQRLVTLVGPGGTGKTRLALAAAAAKLPSMRDGVWFVQLASATNADQIVDLTAHELHVDDRGLESLTTMLHRRLASAELLLVLDNCEHLVAAVASFVEDILTHCPHVRILATSREILDVRGERPIPVSPLGVGDARHPGDAVSLFIERAQAPTSFDSVADYELIADVCRHLDGLPLAIELAAARLRSMSLRQVASRLDDRFALLTGGFRTDTARQRTLEAVVAWSYDLLDDAERATFRRLATFAESFNLDAAEAVAGWGAVNTADVLDLMGHLVDKSLVATVLVRGEYRYQMLETLRQYGREQLVATGEQVESAQRLFAWARARMEQLRIDMRTTSQDATLAAAESDRENFRAVYTAASDIGDFDLALRIATFAPMMLVRERRTAIRELLTVMVDVDPVVHAHALTSYAQFSFNMALFAEGVESARNSAALFEELGDPQHAAWARYFEMFNAWGFNSDESVREVATSLLEEFREQNNQLGLAYALWVSSQLEPDIARAEALVAESEVLFRSIESPFGLAHQLEGRALIALRRDDPARAAECLREALHLLSDGAEQGCTAHVIEAIASLVSHLGLARDAALLLGAAEELRRMSGQAHRPWELRGRELTEQTLAPGQFDDARSEGRQLDFQNAVGVANALLDHPNSGSPPRPLTPRRQT